MTSRVLVVVAVAACNRVLGLDDVAPRDAPIDASTRCPPFGEAPSYTRAIVQYVAQNCFNYQVDRAGDLAIALCPEAETCSTRTYEGPAAGPFVPAVDASFGDVRLDPDGTALYAYDNVTMKLEVLRRAGSAWVANEVIPIGFGFPQLSTVARVGDSVHMILTRLSGGLPTFHEWVEANGTWSEQGSGYTSDMLGTVKAGATLDLSPDGLRLLVETGAANQIEGTMVYLDRASATDRFGPPVPLQLADVSDPFISDDCTRVYFGGLERIFYAQRQ